MPKALDSKSSASTYSATLASTGCTGHSQNSIRCGLNTSFPYGMAEYVFCPQGDPLADTLDAYCGPGSKPDGMTTTYKG